MMPLPGCQNVPLTGSIFGYNFQVKGEMQNV